MIIKSPLIQELLAKTTVKTQQQDIVAFLKARFGPVPRELVAALKKLNDKRALTALVPVAGKCSDLAAFERQMRSKP